MSFLLNGYTATNVTVPLAAMGGGTFLGQLDVGKEVHLTQAINSVDFVMLPALTNQRWSQASCLLNGYTATSAIVGKEALDLTNATNASDTVMLAVLMYIVRLQVSCLLNGYTATNVTVPLAAMGGGMYLGQLDVGKEFPDLTYATNASIAFCNANTANIQASCKSQGEKRS